MSAEKAKALVAMIAPRLKADRPTPCPSGCDRALEGVEAIAVTDAGAHSSPFFSPDGRRVGFFEGRALIIRGLAFGFGLRKGHPGSA